jgi:O-acetyl-ADP-ribose deacetylase (regulator of RNase III)
MIKEINGDITDLPEGINVIVHQANTHNVMGGGVALTLRKKWPECYEEDTRVYNLFVSGCKASGATENDAQEALLGGSSITIPIEINDEGETIRIVNLYGQRLGVNSRDGIPTDYEAVRYGLGRLSLELLREAVSGEKITLGLPYGMGCGLGGGDWDIYRKIIEETLGESGIDTVIVKYG